jgi:PadR family transcriptional regulator PadR
MGTGFFENWTVQLRKGILELCVLSALRGRSLYGYDLVKTLRALDGLVIGEGTIYPILSRFKQEGLVETSLVESNAGPARKYYRLTVRGERQLDEMQAYWEAVKGGVQTLSKERRP